MDSMRVRVAQSFGAIRVAAAGFLAGGVAGFAGMGRAALEYAANLGETSQQIGVTVEQLQILSRIAVQNNVSQESMQRSLALLNRRLGEAKAGMESALRPFKALGFTPQQIQSFNQGGDALRDVAERIMAIPDPARQAAAAAALFGRQGMQLIPMLRRIAEGYDEAAAEAQRMGLITEDQAAQADALMDEFSLLAEVVKTRLAIAMVEGTGGLRGMTIAIGDAIDAFGQASGAVQSFGNWVADWTDRVHLAIAATVQWHGILLDVREAAARVSARGVGGAMGEAGGAAVAALPVNRPAPRAGVGPVNYNMARSGGGGRSRRGGADNAEREREKALRDEAEFQSNLRRFRGDLLRAQQEQVTDAVARSQMEADLLDIEREEYAAGLRLQVATNDLSQARADELLLAYDRVDNEKRQGLVLEQRRATDEEARQVAQVRRDLEAENLRAEADMAETAAERRDMELRLLDLAYRQERARLEAVLADETAGPAAVEEANLRLANLDRWRARQSESIRRNTMGPLEGFLEGLPTTAARANEALQQVAVDGLQSLEDGIVGLIDGTKSLADAFGDMAKSILADLIRIQVQRMIIGPLSNAIGGAFGMPGIGGGMFGAGGGSGSILDAAMRLAPGAFATGGSFVVGGRSGIDRNLLSLNGTPVARVSQGEPVNVGGRRGNGGGNVRVLVDASPLLTAVIVQGDQTAAVTGSANAQSSLHRRAVRRIP